MKKHIVDEKTGFPYTLVGDYYLPWGDLPDDELEQKPIGIWGQRHLRYIKQHNRLLYTKMLTAGKLNAYLADIDEQANEMMERLVRQMAKAQGITEQLKADDMMKWVGLMNNIKDCAEEVVMNDLIYE